MLFIKSYFFLRNHFQTAYQSVIYRNHKSLFATLSEAEAVNYYHKAFHLGCCSSPRSASDYLLIVISDRISKVVKTSNATQAVLVDISNTFYRVWYTGLLYKFKSYGVMKRCFILINYFVVVKKSSSKCVINARILHNFYSDILR